MPYEIQQLRQFGGNRVAWAPKTEQLKQGEMKLLTIAAAAAGTLGIAQAARTG